MTDLDQQRITEWIGDAFAILCVRVGGLSEAERNLRLGFEAILRQLGTSPLRVVAKSTPPLHSRATASTSDLRHILKALDSCLTIFQRYDPVLTHAQRRTQILVRATRRFAEEELQSRSNPPMAIPRVNAPQVSASPFAAVAMS
jgi:hypothetical protein